MISAYRRYATGAMAIGIPGWPLFAFWTASMASVRIVLMAVCASALVEVAIASGHDDRCRGARWRRTLRGAAGLRLRAAVPRGGRRARRAPRRGRRPAGRLLARRANLVVPVAQ